MLMERSISKIFLRMYATRLTQLLQMVKRIQQRHNGDD